MLTAQTDPAGRTTRYGYYADGILKTLTDPSGNVTTVERDIQGRPTARVYADGSRETYAYEPSTARLKSRTDPLGQRTDYAYARDYRVSAADYATPRVSGRWGARRRLLPALGVCCWAAEISLAPMRASTLDHTAMGVARSRVRHQASAHSAAHRTITGASP